MKRTLLGMLVHFACDDIGRRYRARIEGERITAALARAKA